jgi:Carboxypeptidase regulatory-like domain/TonB dependent receptor-like, beta-barrel
MPQYALASLQVALIPRALVRGDLLGKSSPTPVVWRGIGLTVLALLTLSGAQAQDRSRALAVTGTVVDPRSNPVSAAAVTFKQDSGKTVSSSKTDSAGRFRFAAVAPGSYSLEVQRDGFAISTRRLQIGGQPPAPLTISLALAPLVTELSINGDAPAVEVSTEISENRDAASVDENLFDKLPIFDQDYVAAISTFLDAASLGTGGPQLMVNGVAATTIPVSASAIQEVRINRNPYSAEIVRPGRGTIEIITKEGTSVYHGAFNFIFRDSAINARDAFALTRAPEQRRIFEGSLTGPILHSKTTSFLLSGHRQEEDLQSTVFAQGLTGPIQQSVPSPKRDSQISLRIGHQFSADHNAYLQGNEWEYPRMNQGVGGFVLPEAAFNSKQWEREVVFGDRWALSGKWINQFQILVGWEHHATTSVTSGRSIVVQDAFTSGGAQVDHLETERHFQLSEVMSESAAKHVLKFGLNVPDFSHRGIVNHDNFGGTYIFANLASYQAGTPDIFKQQQGSGLTQYTQKEMGLFVQDDYHLRPNFSLSLGLRYSWQNYLQDNTQFAPRMAFAFSPAKHPKTVLRGGGGIFYDRTGAGPIGDTYLYSGQVLQSFTITNNPGYPDPGPLSAQPVDLVQFDPSLREPYTIQYSFSLEQQLARRTTLAVTYYGSVGEHLFRSRDINTPLPPLFAPTVLPNPAFGVIRNIESVGRQSGNSLEIMLRGQVTRYFTGLVQYTMSRTNNNTGGIRWFPANQYNVFGEWSRADFDQRHRFNMLETFSPGKSFTLGLGLTLATGKPYTLTTGTDDFNTGLANARPAGVPRNSLQGPGYADLDLRLARDFYLSREKEKGKVATLALDAFNALNHLNYVSYIGNQSSPFFGRAVSAFPSRRLQLTARFKF